MQTNQKLAKEDFEKAKEDYSSYIKITADIENKIVAIGGELHADAEIKLIKKGARRKSIWGGGFNLSTGEIETNAMINIKAGKNDNPEILDAKIKERFIDLVKKVLHDYLHH